jgi:hypothetical protein
LIEGLRQEFDLVGVEGAGDACLANTRSMPFPASTM